MFVYLRSEPGLYTVGHYSPGGAWHPESDHSSRDDAAKRCAWLNGADAREALRTLMDYVGGWDEKPSHPCGIARDTLRRLEG